MKKEFEEYTDEQKERFNILFAECALLSMLININTDYCVFFDYSGHIYSVSISLAESKSNYNQKVAGSELRTRYPCKEHSEWQYSTIERLEAWRDTMKAILDGHEIESLVLAEVREMVVSYEF